MGKGTKFGNELRRLRIRCGLTQQAVADALHVNRATYTYYETGKTTPSVERLGKISAIFGVSEIHLASLLQIPFEFEDLDNNRAPKKISSDPERVGQLTPQEKTLIAQYRVGSLEQRQKAEEALRPQENECIQISKKMQNNGIT